MAYRQVQVTALQVIFQIMERVIAKTFSDMMKGLPKERRERIESETAREAAEINSI
jgi:hypothetical protein